eukprot:scaffold7104_cov129-Isochrysis_galbana.AAC.1
MRRGGWTWLRSRRRKGRAHAVQKMDETGGPPCVAERRALKLEHSPYGLARIRLLSACLLRDASVPSCTAVVAAPCCGGEASGASAWPRPRGGEASRVAWAIGDQVPERATRGGGARAASSFGGCAWTFVSCMYHDSGRGLEMTLMGETAQSERLSAGCSEGSTDAIRPP